MRDAKTITSYHDVLNAQKPGLIKDPIFMEQIL